MVCSPLICVNIGLDGQPLPHKPTQKRRLGVQDMGLRTSDRIMFNAKASPIQR
jgi:hypothetical protein